MVKGSYCQQMTFYVSLFGLQTIDNILSMFKLTARLKLQFQSGTPFQ